MRSTAAASASCVDLDPRWVIKLIKKGWTEHLQAYKDHVIDQAVTILGAGHDIKCLFTTPKLLEALALRLESMGTSIRKAGITGIFSGGTEFTPQWNRFAHEELLDGAYMTPTYGNTLMGLAASSPSGPHNNYKITYYAPQPRAVIEVVDLDDPTKVVDYGQTGRVKLTTLTREFFMPGFLERDEGEREPPCEQYPWDGVSGVRPYRALAATTTVGVYESSQVRQSIQSNMLHQLTDSSLGPAVHEHGGGRRRPLLDRRADCQGQPRQRRTDPARHAQGAARARGAARDPDRRPDRARRRGRRALHERRRCRWATARRRPTSSCARSRRAPACPSGCAART